MRAGGGPLFFYGTLLDAEIRRAVVGRDLADLRPASVIGFCRRPAKGRSYPVLVHRHGARVGGLAVGDIDRAVLLRLCAYEGCEYRLASVTLLDGDGRRGMGRAFLPHRAVLAAPGDWSLRGWQRVAKKAFLRRLREAAATPGTASRIMARR